MPEPQVNVFIQGPDLSDIESLTASPVNTIDEVVAKLYPSETERSKQTIFLEDLPVQVTGNLIVEEVLPLSVDDATFAPLNLHVTHCQVIAVSVRFNGVVQERHFAPGATIERVRRWAGRRAFGLSHLDASEHVLQLCVDSQRPDRDVHVGVLVDDKCSRVDFDLVPESRVEG